MGVEPLNSRWAQPFPRTGRVLHAPEGSVAKRIEAFPEEVLRVIPHSP